MTKKDYELFANEIHKLRTDMNGKYIEMLAVSDVVELCARVFKRDNQLFQLNKFERACYEGRHIRQSIKAN